MILHSFKFHIMSILWRVPTKFKFFVCMPVLRVCGRKKALRVTFILLPHIYCYFMKKILSNRTSNCSCMGSMNNHHSVFKMDVSQIRKTEIIWINPCGKRRPTSVWTDVLPNDTEIEDDMLNLKWLPVISMVWLFFLQVINLFQNYVCLTMFHFTCLFTILNWLAFPMGYYYP